MQPAFVVSAMPPEAAYGQVLHPELMQSMQGMHMPVMMGPMGPMMAAGPMPPGMMPAGAMAAPQLTQMLVDAARGGRSSNVFFKTRLCNKWRAGACPYGEKCTYAHGEHELRYVPPEVVAQLESQQKLQESMQQRQGGPGAAGGTPAGEQQRGGEEGGMHGGHSGFSGPGMSPGGGGGHQSFYKTRLCIKYMQTGYCHKGGSCTFAHGYEDLRQPGTPMSPGRMSQDPMSPGRMGMGTPPGMPMMHAGMMGGMAMVPAGMTTAGRGMGMPPGSAGGIPMHMQSMQMAAMGMGPQAMQRYPSGGGMQRSPRAGGGHGGHGGRDDAAMGARRRASTVCQIAGVGEAGGEEMRPAAMQAAMADVRSGAAFRESAYADSVTDYVRTNGGPSAS